MDMPVFFYLKSYDNTTKTDRYQIINICLSLSHHEKYYQVWRENIFITEFSFFFIDL